MKTLWKVIFLTAVLSLLFAGICSANEIPGAFSLPVIES